MTAAGSKEGGGILYIVGTPIGNLEDITLRALRVLGEVDLIAAEDTRVTRKLLDRHGIRTPVISYHAHSGRARRQELADLLKGGKKIALVSDAGMPGASDPGADLVRAAREAGAQIVVVPGPSAVPAALAASGIPGQQHLFLGFLPARPAARRKAIQQTRWWHGPIVCFEAPHRLRESLEDLLAVLGDRQAAVARELTKWHEEVVCAPLSELVAHFSQRQPRGEITIVVAPGEAAEGGQPDIAAALAEVAELVAAGLSASRAISHVARHRGLPRRELYQAYVSDTAQEETSSPRARKDGPR